MPSLRSRLLSTISSTSASAQTPSDESGGPSSGDPTTPLLSTLRLQAACIAATLTAGVIFTLTEHDDHQHTWWCAFEVLMQTLLVIVGTAYFRTRTRLFPDSSLLLPPILMVAAFSLLCEPIQRLFLDHGHSFEVLVMHSQCNLMLALSVCGFRLPFQRLAMLLAVFLTIFSCTISNASGLVPLTILFSMSCVTWLVMSWWETVDCRLVDHQPRRQPVLWIVGSVMVFLLLVLPPLGFGNNTLTTALEGFMPSSGGSGSFDPFSRGGVNDGDALVAGNNNIKSFAPLEDAPFLDSVKPSLYDVFNDQFDEPPKKIKDQQRAIALPADLMKHIHQQMAEARQAGREFSLIREDRIANKQKIRDLDSPAMFYVAGPVPARFRMEVYEHFDGITWYPINAEGSDEAQQQGPNTRLKRVGGRHWLKIPPVGRGFEIHEGQATHSLKVANLDGNVIPSPPQLVGVNIAHVDRIDMYRIANTGIASLQRKSVPAMTPINVVSEYIDRNRLLEWKVLFSSLHNANITRILPQTESTNAIKRLAEKWTQGIPRGWQQIAAIESGLRKHCVLDRNARIATDSSAPVADFLLRSRRGPEYLFAASAACMLRSLDYPSRLVSGFYADPENYDSRKQHTAVFAQNAHFWCEVGIGMNTWITIEPSPGYEIAQPPPGLMKRIWNCLVACGHFADRHATALLLALSTLIVVTIYRRLLQDMLMTLRWKWSPRRSSRDRALQLGVLVECRLRLARLDRNSGTTLRRRARHADLSPIRDELTRVADIADVAMFGKSGDDCDRAELDRLAASLSYRRLRRLPQDNVAQSV